MKVTTINYQKVFPLGAYVNERVGMEASLDEGENAQEKLLVLKGLVEDFHAKNNPGLAVETNYAAVPGHPQETQVEKRIGLFTDDIISSPDLQTLESYKLLVKGKPHLEKAYDFRLKELQE